MQECLCCAPHPCRQRHPRTLCEFAQYRTRTSNSWRPLMSLVSGLCTHDDYHPACHPARSFTDGGQEVALSLVPTCGCAALWQQRALVGCSFCCWWQLPSLGCTQGISTRARWRSFSCSRLKCHVAWDWQLLQQTRRCHTIVWSR